MQNNQITWIVAVCGGRGPNVWDSEFEVEAGDIREAVTLAERKIADLHDCAITGISQKD